MTKNGVAHAVEVKTEAKLLSTSRSLSVDRSDAPELEAARRRPATPVGAFGSTSLAPYEGQWWPVVICDFATAPKAFLRSFEPVPGEMVAILLGRRKFIRAKQEYLQEYDPNKDYLANDADTKPTDKQQRRRAKDRIRAFTEDALMCKDHKFWANYIVSGSCADAVDRDRRSSYDTMSRKRDHPSDELDQPQAKKPSHKALPTRCKSRPFAYNSEDSDDEEHGGLFVTGFRRHSAYESGRKSSRGLSQDAYDCVYDIPDRDDDEDESEDDEEVKQESEEETDHKISNPSQIQRDQIKKEENATYNKYAPLPPPISEYECRIFIGDNTREGIIVSRRSLDESPNLRLLIAFDRVSGEYIINLNKDEQAKSLRITENELLKIQPNLRDEPLTPEFPLQQHSTNPRETHLTAMSLISAFITAVKIQHSPLQVSIRDKLWDSRPFEDGTIMDMVRKVGSMGVRLEEVENLMMDIIGEYNSSSSAGFARAVVDTLAGSEMARGDVRWS